MYLFVAIGSMFSTVIMNKLGPIKCMAVGSLFNIPWILCFALAGLRGDYEGSSPLPTYLSTGFITAAVILLSCLNGLGQAIQWVGQGKYMSDCATEETKGFFFSYFWAFYQASQILGSLLAAYCLRQTTEATLFMILAAISFLSSVSSFLLRKPIVDNLSTTSR